MKTDPINDVTGAPLPWVFDGDFVVVDCPHGSYPTVCRPLKEADGNLIAAAGELYVCLEAAVASLAGRGGVDPTLLADSSAALAKARGEGG